MNYIELEKAWKLKLSGSINTKLRGADTNEGYEDIWQEWLSSLYDEEAEKHIYKPRGGYNGEELELDGELIEDLKLIFHERFEKKKLKQAEKKNKPLEGGATEKQIKYANKLYKQAHGENDHYGEGEYTKQFMAEEIKRLLEELEADEDRGKVIEFPKR